MRYSRSLHPDFLILLVSPRPPGVLVSLPRLALSLAALFSIAAFAPATPAQIPESSGTTPNPIPGAGHDYIGGFNETVIPGTGSLSVRIRVIMPPGRGITLPFGFAYDSSGAYYLGGGGWNSASSQVSSGGWSNTAPIMSVSEISTTLTDGTNQQCGATINYVFQDANGGRHSLDLSTFGWIVRNNAGDCSSAYSAAPQGGEGPFLAATSTSTKFTHLFNVQPVTLTDGDGTVFYFPAAGLPGPGGARTWLPSSVTDRDGNFITINSTTTSPEVFSYVDTTGRTVLSDSGFAVNPETVTIAGLGAPYTLNWTTPPAPTFTVTYYPLPNPPPGCGTTGGTVGPPTYAPPPPVVSSISLPNGKSFLFTYDAAYRMVSKITYPSGGYVRYVWGLNLQSVYNNTGGGCGYRYDTPAVTDRYVSFDGTHEVLHQHFTYVTNWDSTYPNQWDTKQTTVTTYDLVRNTNFQTVYTYTPIYPDCAPNADCTFFPSGIPLEQSIAYYDTNGALLQTVTKTWLNERLLTSQQTASANGQTKKTAWSYNSNEMEIERDDYDFGTNGPGPLLRATATNYATFGTNHIVDKPSSIIVYSDAAKTNKVAETDYTYDNPVGTTTSGIVQHSPGCNCGNLTKTARWLNSSGTTLTTTYTNDDTGQRLSMTDPRGNTTSYSYADSYSSGTPPGPTNAYLTNVTYPNTGVAHVEKFAYAYTSGEVTSSTDQNNLITTYKYNDNLARLTETDFPDGGVTTISYNDAAYNPSTPSPSVTTTKKINTSTNLVTISAMDGLGHAVRSEVTSDPQGTIYTDTAYDGLGRVYTVSNPYRSGTDPTTSSGTTTYTYDALGRKLTETYPDNSVLTTAYCAGSTLVTDPVGKWRRSRTDGLGRLVEVDEPNAPGATVASTGCPGTGEPIWVTSYTVDTLGNLKQVVQNSSHQRNFTYDFLSRLLTATNPESGATTYNYDTDTNCSGATSFPGLLVSKVDARGIRTCLQYDALNRETSRSYSNGDHTITTVYDQSSCLGLSTCQNIGHRTSVTDAAGSEAWSYQVDATNQRSVHVDQRTTASGSNNITKTATYYLDLAGNVTQAVYPTNRVVNYTYDAANRPKTAADGSNGITYATDFQTPPTGCLSSAVCYTPQGTFYALSLAQSSSFTGLNLTHTYNNRLQPGEFKASSSGGNAIDITYSFVDPSTNKNAGHVYSITNNLDNSRTQNFTYDQVNRIVSAGTFSTTGANCWGYQYTYDAWGNLLSQAGWTPNYNGCSEPTLAPITADGNNHISPFSYDASGNATNDGTYSYSWDAESQLKSAGGVNYSYDGDGRRVYKSNGKLYWYGAGHDILAETDANGTTTAEYIFFGGKRIAMLPAGGSPLYYVEDMLGSSRVVTQLNGVVCYDADFYPYGGERAVSNTCPQNYKFEGKERDTETGNDDFGARYYSNRFGRWLSADWSAVPTPVPYANLTNPQTLNLYAMVADDPESFADLDGHAALPGSTLSTNPDPSGPQPPSEGCPSMPALGGGTCIKDDQVDKALLAQDEKNKQAQEHNQQPSASQIGAAIGTVGGAVVGAVVGFAEGAAVGTAVEPGGGTVLVGIIGGAKGAQTGAETGAVIGATAGALAPVVYSKSKEAAAKVGKLIDTAIDHLGKLKGPDQDPRKGWRDTVRKSADNISKQADKIANKNLANAARFAADLLRGLVD